MLPGVRKRVFNFHDVLMYVAIARKHLRLMVLLMCFSWLAGLVYYVYARPVYYSRALIRVNEVKQQVGAEQNFAEASRIPGVVKEITAPHIIANTAARLGVKASHQDVMKYFIKKIQARRNSEENIEVEVYPYSFDWAKRWTEAMLQEYLNYREQRRSTELQERIANYQKQREELLKMLDQGHANVTENRAAVNFSAAKIKFEKLSHLHEDLVSVGKRLDDVGRVKLEILDDNLSMVEKLSRISGVLDNQPVGSGVVNPAPNGADPGNPGNPAGNGASNPAQVLTPSLANIGTSWYRFDKQLHELETQKQGLLQEGKLDGHPAMQALQKEIDTVRGKLDGELSDSMRRLELTFTELIAQQKHLNAQLPDYEKIHQEFLAAQQKDEIENGKLTPVKNLLQDLEKSIQKSELAYSRERMELSYGGMLQINDLPVSPHRLLLFLYTTVLGLFMAIGIPFLVEYLDHTLSNLEQVESAFQLRGLGIIPKVENADTSVALLDSPQAKEQNLLENFRVIRTNLLSMGALSKPPQVLMITSAMPKEGKTVVSTNLSLSFAQTGGKTLLIDTDLRRGRLHRFFGYRKQPGLSGVLLGQCTLEEAIRPTPHENLFIISAGQHLETGTELLGSPKFHELMADLRKRFDRIILDTPPVLGLSETSVLQSQVDGVLFVIWSGYTPIKGVKAAIEMLQANGANFYGFVLNRLDLNATANYYQYYYYSHDYYYQYSPRSLENA